MNLPASLAESLWARARWFVLAPHPDDETLGAGALIAEAAAAGRLAGIAFLTAGEGSHTHAGQALAAARRAEAAEALRRLTGARPEIFWIGWPDAHPRPAIDAAYARDARELGALLRRVRAGALAVTAECEPHCDHAAACHFARAAVRASGRRITVFQYLVWAPRFAGPARAVRTRAIPPTRRRLALEAHRSQLTPRFGQGFRLPVAQRRARAWDILYLAEAHP